MVSSSKILTVSYGTFSCTAEGFDDPLAVVKDTTHFFRGVIGEDRFFGAEPPRFDPELATEMMRDQIAADHGKGMLSLGAAPLATGAASSGALAAALTAGPARPRPASSAEAPADPLPDDDTIEATAILTETEAGDAPRTDLSAAAESVVPEAITAQPAEAETTAPAPVASEETAGVPHQDSADVPPQDISEREEDSAEQPLSDESEIAPVDPCTDPAEESAPAQRFSDPLGVAAKLRRIRDVVAGRPPEAAAHPAAAPEVAEPTVSLQPDRQATTLAADPHTTDGPDEAATADAEDDMLAALAADLADTETSEDAEQAHADTTDKGEVVDDAALDALIGALESAPEEAADRSDTETLSAGIDNADPAEETAADAAAENLFADTIASMVAQEAEPTGADEPDADLADLAEAEGDISEPADGGDRMPERPVDTGLDDTSDLPPAAPQPQAPIRARVVKVKRADFERAVASGTLEEITEDADLSGDAALPHRQDDSSLSPEEEEDLARELAAVKAELSGELDTWTGIADDDAPYDTADTARTADAEDAVADGMEEAAPFRLDNPLPAEDRDWDDGTDTAGTTQPLAPVAAAEGIVRDSARKAVKMASPARAMLTEREVEDDDTSRLMDQTKAEMDEPEGHRRRSAIAHLRAAVAATKADRLLSPRAETKDEEEPYREDLASVVRPRRPQTAGARTERPADPAPAPLKLVAEQRVGSHAAEGDDPTATDDPTAPTPRVTPVRPRRVRRAAQSRTSREAPAPLTLSGPGDAEGFAAYASSVGAVALPELLEAAAAYMSYVEGRDQFSRPQLMTTVRQAELSESSREDRLRSFGQLLREGKIQKTSGGRFTASERISFKPERAAG